MQRVLEGRLRLDRHDGDIQGTILAETAITVANGSTIDGDSSRHG